MGKVKTIIQGRTKQDRKANRKALGPLRSITVAPKTRARYDSALRQFYLFAKLYRRRVPDEPSALDSLFSEYIEFLWEEGESISAATDGLSGLQDLKPSLRGCLALSWRLVKTWQKNEMPSRAAPLPEELLQALSGAFALKGQSQMALAVQVAFYSLLRTGELLSLQASQVQISPRQDFAVLNLGLTKTSQRSGTDDSVTLRVGHVCRALAHWKQAVAPSAFLIPFSSYLFRKHFQEGLERLKLGQWGFRPYSLRRGGATMYFQKNPSFDAVRQLGRWSSDRTARIYLNDAMASLALMRLDVTSKPLALPFQWYHRQLRLDREATRGGRG